MSKADHGTIPHGIPGWYVQFQSDILLQLPRPSEISEEIALGWHNNRAAMKKTLREALLPPNKPTMEVQPRSLTIVVDCDANPRIPSSLSLEGEGVEHRRMGKVTLEKRGDGKLYANGIEVGRYLSLDQKGGNHTQGHRLRKELEDRQVLNACILDALLRRPQLIPDEWKTGYTYFWGTIFRYYVDGSLYVRYLYWDGGGWNWNIRWLDLGWDESYLAAWVAS